jgi:hypothetical protein
VSEAPRWETREDIESEAWSRGLPPPSPDQLERWRGRHLLKTARQISNFKGSVSEFTPGTARQAVRLVELLRIKEKLDHVGWELWWEGYDVGEEWWMPQLREAAEKADAGLKRVRWLVARWSSGASDSDEETEFDKLEREAPANALGWQVARRLKIGETATYLRILSEVASGKFSGFEEDAKRSDGSDYDIALRGLDLGRSGGYPGDAKGDAAMADRIFGRDLNLVSALRYVFRDMSAMLRKHSLSDVLAFPIDEVRSARDDVRRALEIGTNLYDCGEWIFGPGAFGLRIMPWLARRPASQRANVILGFALLRRSKHPFLTSAEITALKDQSAQARRDLVKLKQLAEVNSKLARVITPKGLRRAFSSFDEFERFRSIVAAASIYIDSSPEAKR